MCVCIYQVVKYRKRAVLTVCVCVCVCVGLHKAECLVSEMVVVAALYFVC